MNNVDLRRIFQSQFDYQTYCNDIVHCIFGCNDINKRPEQIKVTAEGDKCHFIGRMTDTEGRELGFFYTQLAPGGDVRRKRVGLRKLIAPYVRYEVDAAIAVFDDGTRWRLSYICDMNEGATSPKRFSYVLGDAEGQYNTPTHRLGDLSGKLRTLRISDIFDAFSVETLSKEFFEKYHIHYDCIVSELARQGKTGAVYHDYVKKLMGRIVFLHFLQKKGWLCGDTNFMLNTFSQSNRKNDYLESVLEPLFFGILNTEPAKREQVFNRNGWQQSLVEKWASIPYLNGGLFERDAVDDLRIVLPESIFSDLFHFLASYNFTVDENDPDDAEIGVDPEMLGKIFESLLEDNKAKGAFYTPKEIVRYMCKESLIAYLASKLPDTQENVVRTFVESHETPPELEPYRNTLIQVLRDVKICDPAIGSGAFPMGLLNELWRCREALEPSESRVALKKEIIENNIYGVDIERGAIDIARLRFWLSIVVDSEKAEPLPNFDYKFMQGNSLIESYQGCDLSRIAGKTVGRPSTSTQLVMGLDSDLSRKNLQRLLRDYFSVTDHQKKANMRQAINDEVKTLLRESLGGTTATLAKLEKLDPSANQDFFLWHTWFKDIFDNGGFDIVIGNPPYLESRSPDFKDELKDALQIEISKNRQLDQQFFPRGADLLIYFFELSFRLLSKDGQSVLITENAWLSTDYGKLFQEFLLKKCNITGIIDSDYKYFENADINTVITFIKNKTPKDGITPIRFYHSHGNIKDYPCNTLSSQETKNVSIKQFMSNERFLSAYKWGVVQKADDRLIQIMESLFKYEDRQLAQKISIGQGLNITKNHIIFSESKSVVPYFTSEEGPQYVWTESSCFVSPSVASSTRKKPLLILPRGLGTHFCCINQCGGYTSSYVEVYGNINEDEMLNIWLFCNSSLLWLLREVTGRTNLGGGMLKAEATDLRSIPICYDFRSHHRIAKLYNHLKSHHMSTNLLDTLQESNHMEIDNIVLSSLGLENEKEYIIQQLIKMVNNRMKKSKNK
jgi:type I restriction-modification system DNA methylase subunit